jgi:hypothetical protein
MAAIPFVNDMVLINFGWQAPVVRFVNLPVNDKGRRLDHVHNVAKHAADGWAKQSQNDDHDHSNQNKN